MYNEIVVDSARTGSGGMQACPVWPCLGVPCKCECSVSAETSRSQGPFGLFPVSRWVDQHNTLNKASEIDMRPEGWERCNS